MGAHRPGHCGASRPGCRWSSSARSRSVCRSAPRGGSSRSRSRLRRDRGAHRRRDDRRGARDGRGDVRRGRRERKRRAAGERYGSRPSARPPGPEGGTRDSTSPAARGRAPRERSAPAAVVGPPRRRRAALGRGGWPSSIHDPAGFVDDAARRLSSSWPTPSTATGSSAVAPGHRARARRARPLLAAVSRALPDATRRRRRRPLLYVADRLFREPRARGPLARVRHARAPRRRRARTDLAAPPPGRARGRRLDHRRFASPTPSARASSPSRIAGRSSSSSSTRRRAGSDGSWARRSQPSRSSTAAPGATPRSLSTAWPPGPSLIGDAEPDVQKALSWALRRWCHRPWRRRGGSSTREAAVATATADGHRALGDPRHAREARPGRDARAELATKPGAASGRGARRPVRRPTRLGDRRADTRVRPRRRRQPSARAAEHAERPRHATRREHATLNQRPPGRARRATT